MIKPIKNKINKKEVKMRTYSLGFLTYPLSFVGRNKLRPFVAFISNFYKNEVSLK